MCSFHFVNVFTVNQYLSCHCSTTAVTHSSSNGITYIAHPPESAEAVLLITNPFDSRPSIYLPRAAVQSDANYISLHWAG